MVDAYMIIQFAFLLLFLFLKGATLYGKTIVKFQISREPAPDICKMNNLLGYTSKQIRSYMSRTITWFFIYLMEFII